MQRYLRRNSAKGADALLIVPGLDAYVSPNWYRSKAEHGRAVPTWNYEVVHVHGTIEVHHDPDWKRLMVSDLTDQSERQTFADGDTEPWQVSDAPADFTDRQLGAIVGIHLAVSRVEAKAKLSQNKSEPDRQGAAAGLTTSGRTQDRAIADRTSRSRP